MLGRGVNRLSPLTPGQGLGEGPPWLSHADTFASKAVSTVRLLICELRSHMPRGQKLKMEAEGML